MATIKFEANIEDELLSDVLKIEIAFVRKDTPIVVIQNNNQTSQIAQQEFTDDTSDFIDIIDEQEVTEVTKESKKETSDEDEDEYNALDDMIYYPEDEDEDSNV